MIYVAYTFALLLVLICLFAVLVILMQRPSANAGMGSALAGGAAESVFGGGTTEMLGKITYALIALFFLISFGLYLGFLVEGKNRGKGADALDVLTKPPVTAPTETTAPAVTPTEPPVTPSAPTAAPESATPQIEFPSPPPPAPKPAEPVLEIPAQPVPEATPPIPAPETPTPVPVPEAPAVAPVPEVSTPEITPAPAPATEVPALSPAQPVPEATPPAPTPEPAP